MTAWTTALFKQDESPTDVIGSAFTTVGPLGLMPVVAPLGALVKKDEQPTAIIGSSFTTTANGLMPIGAAKGDYPYTRHAGWPGGTLADQGGSVEIA